MLKGINMEAKYIYQFRKLNCLEWNQIVILAKIYRVPYGRKTKRELAKVLAVIIKDREINGEVKNGL